MNFKQLSTFERAIVRDYIRTVHNETDGSFKLQLDHITSGILNVQFIYDLKAQDVGKIAINLSFERSYWR